MGGGQGDVTVAATVVRRRWEDEAAVALVLLSSPLLVVRDDCPVAPSAVTITRLPLLLQACGHLGVGMDVGVRLTSMGLRRGQGQGDGGDASVGPHRRGSRRCALHGPVARPLAVGRGLGLGRGGAWGGRVSIAGGPIRLVVLVLRHGQQSSGARVRIGVGGRGRGGRRGREGPLGWGCKGRRVGRGGGRGR